MICERFAFQSSNSSSSDMNSPFKSGFGYPLAAILRCNAEHRPLNLAMSDELLAGFAFF